MKIGILTLPLHTNYGGILQAYALQTVLECMGHQCEIVHFVYPFWPNWKKILWMVISFLRGKKVDWFYAKKYPKKMAPSMININRFIHKYIVLSDEVRSLSKMKKIAKNYDAFVVGSDQVWRPIYAQYIELFFCSFLKKSDARLRIAYAVSMGTSDREYNEKKQKRCGSLVQLFKGVSVRENDAVDLIENVYRWNVSPVVTLDPTLLLDKNIYKKIIDGAEHRNLNSGKIFYYFLDNNNEKEDLLATVCRLKKRNAFTVYKKEPNYYYDVIEPMPSVEAWLQGFLDSDFVVTDSFHGCVFSIIFHKPFIVIGNKNRGISRFKTLLGNFDLNKRMVYSFDQMCIEKIVSEDIDWNLIDKRKEDLVNKSIDYLQKCLGE